MEKNTPQVAILAGGFGTRLREETEFKPKPLIPIGGKPILYHILKRYSNYGFKDFIICLGYKGEEIKEYFLNYKTLNSNFKIDLSTNDIEIYDSSVEEDWKITLIDTGMNAMTGARVKRIEKYITSENFMLTYGDGVADIDIKSLYDFHLSHGKTATITGVSPPSRFGHLNVENDKVIKFDEKPSGLEDDFINGGFFVLNKNVFKYLNDDDECTFEQKPLENMSNDGELMVYTHKGFWQCMDTYRDMTYLEKLWKSGNAPWI